MTHEEFLESPGVRSTLNGFEKWRDDLIGMAAHTREIRERTVASQGRNADAAALLISLLDQRLEILAGSIRDTERLSQIVSSGGLRADEPFEEMTGLMNKLATDQKILKILIRESMKITPESQLKETVN